MECRRCASCGQAFQPRAQVPQQRYCGLAACQRERRRRWQRNKLQGDPDYRANPTNRCYFCKTELYGDIAALAREEGLDCIANGLIDEADWNRYAQQLTAQIMAERKFRHIPVVEDGNLIGVVSIRDLVTTGMHIYSAEAHFGSDFP